ncbi:MAG: O-antigen ligase family protein [Thermodesulfobacteriota bacterium]
MAEGFLYNWRRARYFEPDQEKSTRRARLAGWAEAGALICLTGLAALLPFQAITASREICLHLGLFFWLARMVVLRRWDLVRTPLDIPLALFLAAGVFSLFSAVDVAYTWRELRGEMLKGLLVYYLAVNNLRGEARAGLVCWALIAAAAVMDVYGVIESFSLPSGRAVFSLHASSPQLFTWLVQSAPFLMLGALWFKNKKARLAVTLILVLHAAVLYLSLGRMAMVAVVMEAALVLYLAGLSRRVILLGCLAILLGLALLMPRPIITLDDQSGRELRIGGLAVPGLKSTRLVMWQGAWDHIRDHPWTGVGFGRRSFVKKYPDYLKIEPEMWHTHNTFISLAVETGLQGLAAFCLVLYQVFRRLWPGAETARVWLRSGPAGLMILGALIMAAGFILSNLTNDMFDDDAALLFWLLIGASFSLRQHKAVPAPPD